MSTQSLKVAVEGRHEELEALRAAAVDGGAELVPAAQAAAMVWVGGAAAELASALESAGDVGWLQLPSAGIEDYLEVLREHPGLTITCAKNIYGDSVSEHAVAMLLALRRGVILHAKQQRWDASVFGQPLVGSGDVITILGGGGIAARFASLIEPFGVDVRIVRRDTSGEFPAPYAQMFNDGNLSPALSGAKALIITLPLTDQTRGLIGEPQLRLLSPGAVVINVGRGGVLDTDGLLSCLRDGHIGGAGLDVTDPEPLPEDHPLWQEPGALITSHTSNPSLWRSAKLAQMIRANVSAYAEGKPLQGLVDLTAGY